MPSCKGLQVLVALASSGGPADHGESAPGSGSGSWSSNDQRSFPRRRGDYQDYVLYATSEYGSGLYVFFENPTLYLALVVDRSVNDNVFDRDGGTDYLDSAGWGKKKHPASKLTDSEYASFELYCIGADTKSWLWAQGYARLDDNTWISDELGAGFGTPPFSFESSSSFVWNMNSFAAATLPPWDLYAYESEAITDWKSPFVSEAPGTVIGLEGYPASGPITFNTTYQYEWPMVYEWSVDLDQAGCGDYSYFFIVGESHHSPIKNDDIDEDDNFYDLPTDPFRDFGDLPDIYGTYLASAGAAHTILINGASLGRPPDMELDGQPTSGAAGDGSAGIEDEDGVTRIGGRWENGAMVGVDLDVRGSTETADIAMWIDWNGNGGFMDAGEYYAFLNRPTGSIVSESIVVPDATTYAQGDPLYVRVRIMNDEVDAPGGTLDPGDFLGTAASGEVEDYCWDFSPTAVGLQSFGEDTGSSSGVLVWLGSLAVLVLAGLSILAARRLRPIRMPVNRSE